MIDTPFQIVQPQGEERKFINHAYRWMFYR